MPRLLLVEDEQVNRELFRRRLERKGHAVIPAENGLTAVELTKSEMPDLVLMDLGLPDIDGWEATRRIKTDPATAGVPVVVLSAHATTEAREKAFAAGCEEFETKPVNWEALFQKIDAALARAAERAKELAAVPPPPAEEIDFGSTPDPGTGIEVLRKRPVEGYEHEVCAVQPKRILVVEDNDPNRVMLCRRLNRHGYATTEAADGRAALDAITKQRFDLVLCDIMMPDMDGYEVLKEIKANPDLDAIPIIMVSAVDETASVVKCLELGAEDYLHKPYDPILLIARVNACLDKRRLRDQENEYRQVVTDLTKAAELVEKGEYDPAVLAAVADRSDALGTLARVFDHMARDMQARVKQLQSDVQRLADDKAHRSRSPAESTLTLPKPQVPKPPK